MKDSVSPAFAAIEEVRLTKTLSSLYRWRRHGRLDLLELAEDALELVRRHAATRVRHHNLDGDGLSQISVYSERGILSESQGPVWLIGTGKHTATNRGLCTTLISLSRLGASRHLSVPFC